MDQSSFVDLLQETSADHVGHLEGSANHDFRQIRFPFVCIRVHPWPNCMSGARWVKISEKLLPGHGWTRIHTNFIIQLFRGQYTGLEAGQSEFDRRPPAPSRHSET